MSRDLRIGLCTLPRDSFWLQAGEAIYRRRQGLPLELVPVHADERLQFPSEDEPGQGAEPLLALDLDALIGWPWSGGLACRVLESGLPVVHLCETPVRHPLSVSPLGLHEAARTLADHIARRLAGRGRLLVVGGLSREGLEDDGSSRLAGIREALRDYPAISLDHIPCSWNYEEAWQQVQLALPRFCEPFDAILGLSDPLALAAGDASRSLGLAGRRTLVGGIRGDPEALAAIASGEMAATVAVYPEDLGQNALDLAYEAARKMPLPGHFAYRRHLVTQEDVTATMAHRLTTLAGVPGWLTEVHEQRQEQRLSQLEASLEIICRIQSKLDSHRQLRDVVELICNEYGYDRARIYRWVEREQRLFLIYPDSPGALDVWYDLLDGSAVDLLQGAPGPAGMDESPEGRVAGSDPGSVIIADGLGWVGEWYDVTGEPSNSVVDQIAVWATAESKAFAREFEARYGLKPSPSAAGLSHDYANMWIQLAWQTLLELGELSSGALADFVWSRLLTGEWSYARGCIMREYRYLPQTVPDPVVGPRAFTFSVLEYVDGEASVIFPTEPVGRDLAVDGQAPDAGGWLPGSTPDRTFKLGVMGPFSGPNALVGAEIKGAVELAFERIDYSIGPYRIELVWIDSQSDPAVAAAAYEEAIVRDGIQAGLLNWHTPVALACMELAAAHRIPHLFGLGGGGGVNKKWQTDPERYFYWVKGWPEPGKLTGNYVQALEDAIQQGLWRPKAKTAALWGEDTDWGRSFAAGMREQLRAAGWEIPAEAYFPLHETDFVPLLTKIKEINPALLAGTASDPHTFSAFVTQAHKLGLERMFGWSPGSQPSIPLEESDVLGRALLRNEVVYIPARARSAQPRDLWSSAEPRARLVVPIRHGDRVLGLIDLRSHRGTWHSRLELVGLQVLADQLGLAMRDAELYGQALRARAIAEESGRSKTRLLAEVSHELRTPLNVILGYTQRALDSFQPYHADLPRAITDDLQQIHQASEHLLQVTNDLLELSQAEIDQLRLIPRMIDPCPLLADAFHSIEHSAVSGAAGAVEWRLDLPERLPLIQADAVRLRQVVFNLLHNARRFTDHGRITLGADVLPPSLHLWVQDTGLGIPTERQERIFEPFVTAGHADRSREGTGLGLSIVRRLVALHQGSVGVESQPGEGSTFHIYLPLPSLPGEPGPAGAPVGRLLLLVSGADQPPAELAALGQRHGLQIQQLRLDDPLDDLLAGAQPAALAWDLNQRSPDAGCLLERLRRYPLLHRIPLIVYGNRPSEGAGAWMAPTALVTKPVDPKSLLEAMALVRPGPATGQILVVDDDLLTREYLAGLIAQACPEYEVRTAADGTLALDRLAEAVPSLLILDLKMPGMDGFEVLERMRAEERTSRVPVLVLTGQALSADDIGRLERYALVTVQTKGILTDDEIAAALHRSLVGADALPPETSALVKRAIAYFQQNYGDPLTRDELAAALGVSQNYFSQIFRKELGISPWDYLTRYRIRQAERLLRCTSESITSIALRVGFEDPSYFGRVFRRETGQSPSAYRAS